MKPSVFPDRAFLKMVILLALPVALQNMMVSLLNVLDVFLIQGLGDDAVASVSLGGQVGFVINLIVFGIASGGSVLMAQYDGKGETYGVRRSAALSVLIVTVVSLVISLFAFLFPRSVMKLFTDGEALLDGGVAYLRYAAPSFFLAGISYAFATLLRCTHKPKLPLIASTIALSLNTLLNFLLIYGAGCFPCMGISGAGLATLIARVVELGLMIWFVYYKNESCYRISLRDFCSIHLPFVTLFFKTALPVIVGESVWGLGFASFSAIYGHMGASSVTAMNVAGTLEQLLNTFFRGLATAALILIGNDIGANQLKNAQQSAKRFLVFSFGIGLCGTVIMLAFARPFVTFLFSDISKEASELAVLAIRILAVYLPFRGTASVSIVGIMRSGGDNFRALCYDAFVIYVWSLPLGILTGIIWDCPLGIVLSAIMSKRVLKCGLGVKRVLSNQWIHRVC